MKSLVLYNTMGGNTEKVSERIHNMLETERLKSDLIKLEVRIPVNLDTNSNNTWTVIPILSGQLFQ